MEEEKLYTLTLTQKDVKDSRVFNLLRDLTNQVLSNQKTEYYEVSEAMLLVLEKMGGLVTKDKYNNQVKYVGEIGKYKGKRVVLKT